MGLTSGPFVTLMIVIAVAGLSCTVWLWPRAVGASAGRLLARLGLLAGCQLLVIAALVVWLNGYFEFFGSWTALLGVGGHPSVSVGAAVRYHRGRPIAITGTDLGPVPGGSSALPERLNGRLANKPPRYRASRRRVTGLAAAGAPDLRGSAARAAKRDGEVLQVAMHGERTGISVHADYVYLPPQYFRRQYAHTRFPVVLALTGYPNDTWSIVKRLELPATAARLVAGHEIGPAVYVMMNVSPALPRDTECTNIPAGPQVETFFAEDVPVAIERSFRVQSTRSGWAVLGYSTGGYCAAKLAMLNPNRFSAAVSMAAYYVALQDRTTGNLYGGSAGYRNENNLDWRLRHLPAPPVSVLVTSSRVGEKDLPGTLQFLHLIRPPMQGYSLLVPQGGHNYGTWLRELPQSLEWLNKRLQPAVPRAGAQRGVALR
jgi:enterochelin esterase-like enzyme